MTTTLTSTPRVWVGCLASYNNGDLFGEWVDAIDEDDLHEDIQRILAASPSPGAEEWFFADFDNFYGFGSEYTSVSTICRVGAFLEEHDEAGGAFVKAYSCEIGNDIDFLDSFDERFAGEADSERDWNEQEFEDCVLDPFRQMLHDADKLGFRSDLEGFFERNIEPLIDTERYEAGNVTTVMVDGTMYAFRDDV